MIREFYYFNKRLTERLNRIRRKPFTIVCARSGMGKRTAVQAYLMNMKGKTIWHVSDAKSQEAFAGEIQQLFTQEITGYQRGTNLKDNVATENPLHEIEDHLRNVIQEQNLFYVAEIRGDVSPGVLDFLYRLATAHIHHFFIILITEIKSLHGLEKDTDSYVNLITEPFFLMDQEDIQKSFGEQGISLLSEEAAMIFHYTHGWVPLVGSIFRLLCQYRKADAWEAVPNLFISWEDKLDEPEKTDYTPHQRAIFTRMSPAETFTLEEALRICARPEAPVLPVCDEKELRKALRPNYLPPFAYYSERSGLYHVHYLLAQRFQSDFEDLPQTEREVVGNMLAERKTDVEGFLQSVNAIHDDILALRIDDAKNKLREFELAHRPADRSKAARLQLLSAWAEVLSGRARYAMEQLEKVVRECYVDGRWADGEMLISGSLLMREFLGHDYRQNIEGAEEWMLRHRSSRQDVFPGENILFLILALLHREDMKQLEVYLSRLGEQGQPLSETLRRLGLAASRGAQGKKAEEDLVEAIRLGNRHNLRLPFVVFYEHLLPLFPKKAEDEALEAFLSTVRAAVNPYRRKMRKNYEKHQDAYGAQLTARQTEIVELLRQRLSNKEIADRLGISENTVKTLVKTIFQKLGVESRRSFYD